jgi:hypothetical protein
VLVRVKAVVCCVIVSDHFIKYFVRGTLYKDALYNKPEFSKVCHFFYNSFSERFQAVPLGGIAQNTLNNIMYNFCIFIHYVFKVIITSS